MECPEPDTLFDYLAAKLDARGTARIREHIATCSPCREIASDLVQSAAAGVRNASSPPRVRASAYELLPGASIGERYILEHEIGGGSMGVVWRASRDGTPVAIKLLKGIGVEARRRFAREASIASALVHPGLVRVIEILADVEAGCPALVMELLEGEPLSARLARAPLTAHEAVELGVRAAAALAHVHARGIVHRDLKPANVFLTTDGVKILDLGLATRTEDSERITRTGQAVGTLAYMAPEQLAGAKVDGRADVWSLGIVLWHAVCGKLPFSARTPAALLRTIEGAAPPRLASHDARLGALIEAMLVPSLDVRPCMPEIAARFASLSQAW